MKAQDQWPLLYDPEFQPTDFVASFAFAKHDVAILGRASQIARHYGQKTLALELERSKQAVASR
jgi:hypothetical protein